MGYRLGLPQLKTLGRGCLEIKMATCRVSGNLDVCVLCEHLSFVELYIRCMPRPVTNAADNQKPFIKFKAAPLCEIDLLYSINFVGRAIMKYDRPLSMLPLLPTHAALHSFSMNAQARMFCTPSQYVAQPRRPNAWSFSSWLVKAMTRRATESLYKDIQHLVDL